jgi:hypothetical protein
MAQRPSCLQRARAHLQAREGDFRGVIVWGHAEGDVRHLERRLCGRDLDGSRRVMPPLYALVDRMGGEREEQHKQRGVEEVSV